MEVSNNNPENFKGKTFGLSTFSVKNTTTVFVLAIIIVISGLSAYVSMPSETFPEIVTPEIYVGTPYPGNSPLDIEKLITRPLEKEIKSISGIDELKSTSVQGYSTIQVKFNFDVTADEALRKVKDKVDVAKSSADFPSDLPAEPNVFELNFSELVPIMNINLSGEFSVDQLNKYAEYLEDEIEALSEISKVEIRGVDQKEMRISVDLPRMESLNLGFNDIAQAIQAENVSISGGDLLVDGYRRNIRVIGEFKSVEEIENVIVKHENGNIVYLKEIADVAFGEVEAESYAREYTKPVVMVDVMKKAGQNLVIVSEKIKTILDESKGTVFPEDLQITITNDQSGRTKNQLAELENSIIFGVLLVVLVLMFFLGLRNALFVGIAIPMSMLMSFFILSAIGFTLNTIVLFALVLALGMLVDNGIVVVENIYRLMDEGQDNEKASIFGAGEVAIPIIASTATTLAAFLPLAFWPGIFGEFMKFLPITLIVVLSSSLFVGLVINPAFTRRFMRLEEKPIQKTKWTRIGLIFSVIGVGVSFLFDPFVEANIMWLGNVLIAIGVSILGYIYILVPGTDFFQKTLLVRIEAVYERTLKFALKGKNPYFFFFGSIGLLIFAIGLFAAFPPNVLFFPENEPNRADIFVEMPIGTDIEVVNSLTKEIEAEVLEAIKRYEVTEVVDGKEKTFNFMVESVIAQVGEGTGDPSQGVSMAKTPNKAKVTVAFVEYAYRRGIKSSDVLDVIREATRGHAGTQIVVAKDAQGPPAGAPLNIEIIGDDYMQLVETSEEIRTFIENSGVEGFEELKIDVEQGKPEMPIIIDRVKARTFGISSGQIGDALRTALFGKEVSRYKDGEDDYPINIRFQDEFRYNIDDLMNQRITFRDPANGRIKQIPISAVATPMKTSTVSSVKRSDMSRVITISSNVLSGYNPTLLNEQVKKVLQDFALPEGIEVKFTGEQEKQAEELGFLSGALMIAVFLIFLILVAQFNSASTPFIILTTVVLSLIGVFLGLIIFRMEFVIMMTMIGIISLAGIVVNNAIVLIDYTKLLMSRRKEALGLDESARLSMEDTYLAIVEGGKTRLRPVLLTAITTILGLLPLAIGLNINFFTLISAGDPQISIGGDNVMFWGPMSWTVVFGLTFATFLTLVVVPVMFYILSRIKYRLGIRNVK